MPRSWGGGCSWNSALLGNVETGLFNGFTMLVFGSYGHLNTWFGILSYSFLLILTLQESSYGCILDPYVWYGDLVELEDFLDAESSRRSNHPKILVSVCLPIPTAIISVASFCCTCRPIPRGRDNLWISFISSRNNL